MGSLEFAHSQTDIGGVLDLDKKLLVGVVDVLFLLEEEKRVIVLQIDKGRILLMG